MRESGILLPIFSLPSNYGIGCFSKEAYEFIDCLKEAKQSYWQLLPLGPTSYGDSPYQSFSTFAGNPYFIDLEDLIQRGYITKKQCDAYDFGSDAEYIDYGKLYASRFLILKEAFENSNISRDQGFAMFVKENAFWLDDYALFMAVKESFDHVSWVEWDDDIKLRTKEALDKYRKKFARQIEYYQFQQYMFMLQWKKLKAYANENGIKIIGDIPIYVALDSADAWANKELFQFDEMCNPTDVAGCPPDGFSEIGQVWGNPLYRWDYHSETDYEWWMQRLEACFNMYDIVRIDHFRGFDAYYSIPFGAVTAKQGTWIKGPGYEFIDIMKKKLGKREVIAEDLGFLTPSVLELVERSGYAGMKILQFAFDSRDENRDLPHNYNSKCVAYTGTHDNDTMMGWYRTVNKTDRTFCKKYLNLGNDEKEFPWEFVRSLFASEAELVIIPVQDYLGLGSEARINIPSTLGNNWMWRMQKGDFKGHIIKKIADMTTTYLRTRERLPEGTCEKK